MTRTTDTNVAKKHLAAMLDAAARGDVQSFLLELAASRLLDAVTHRLSRTWPKALPGSIEIAVTSAAEALYERASTGAVVSPAGYVWGAARNRLLKEHRAGLVDTASLDADTDELRGTIFEEEERSSDEGSREEAIAFARSVLPELGEGPVRDVMAFILDCVEAGELYIDNLTIAAALGLSPMTVRRSKSRGFQRLARAAQCRKVLTPQTSRVAEVRRSSFSGAPMAIAS
jgi:DNA-directed RNA polymerase specialized sigma24 family protein